MGASGSRIYFFQADVMFTQPARAVSKKPSKFSIWVAYVQQDHRAAIANTVP